MLNESDELDGSLNNPEAASKQPMPPSAAFSDSPTKGEEKEVSILFANLYGVERLTLGMAIETRVELFNHYFSVMVETVFEYRGSIDKYIGSTIMAVFNSPLPLEDHALMAVKAALAMRDRLPQINHHWFPEAANPLSIGIGINTDRVFCGYVGSPLKAEFTAIGHGVNVASHLSNQAQSYGCDILIGQKTYESCGQAIQIKTREATQLKPKGKAFNVYELLGLNAGV